MALREAFSKIGNRRVLGMLLAHRTRWQYGDPDALALLVAELWLDHRMDAAEHAHLTWARLEDPSVVPRDLVVHVEAALPASLAGRTVVMEARGRFLVFQVGGGPGERITLDGTKPRLLELGTDETPRPVLVWKLSDRWYAAPAATASGIVMGERITLLDGDLDGRLEAVCRSDPGRLGGWAGFAPAT